MRDERCGKKRSGICSYEYGGGVRKEISGK